MVEEHKDQDSDSPTSDNTDAPKGTASESDIMAIKRAHDVELRERDTKMSQFTQEVATERAAKEAAEVKLQESQTRLGVTEKEVSDLRTVQDASTKAIEELRASRLSDRKSFMMKSHGLTEDQIKDMDESQLQALESVLPSIKAIPNAANLDIGSSSGAGDISNMSSRDKISAGLRGSS